MNRLFFIGLAAAFFLLAGFAEIYGGNQMSDSILTKKECAVVDIGAAVARGDQTALAGALNRGFDAGITLNETKEYIGQLYAYCGFPRALNAAATLMKVAAGKKPAEGRAPNPPPAGKRSISGLPTRRSSAAHRSRDRCSIFISSWMNI